MKTLKFGLVAIFLAFITMGYAINDPTETGSQSYTKISLHQALNNRTLTQAIYQQVDKSFLGHNCEHRLYYAVVRCQKGAFLIYGKYAEWMDFFLRDKIVGNIRNR